jgi:hypothetical protein
LYGVAELLEPLAELVPTLLVAVTVNVYAVPVVNPDTVIGELAPVPVTPPGEDVTVYTVIGLPPSLAGGVKVIKALAMPAVAVPIVGAPGAETGPDSSVNPLPIVIPGVIIKPIYSFC